MKNLVTSLRRSMMKRVGSALALILIGSFFVFNLGCPDQRASSEPIEEHQGSI